MTPPPRTTNRAVTTGAILLSLFMAAMEATVVATAMPTVVAELGGLELYGWVGAVYLLGSTVTMPIYGKLSDLYGRKPLMLVGIGIFLLGSMASGLSQSMMQLIAFRGLQALGAGGLQTLAFTVAGDIYTAQERARIPGIFGAVWAIAGMSGPFLGGLLVKYLSWRWVFYVNVPVGLLAAALYVGAFHESVKKRQVQLDLAGAALLSGGVIALLLATSRVLPAVTIPAAMVLIALFVVTEHRAPEALLPPALLRRKVIWMSCVLSASVGASLMSVLTYLPLYMQAILGASPTQAGSVLAPLLVGWPIASALTARLLARFSYRTMVITGWTFGAIACVVLAAQVRGTASMPVIYVLMFLLGAGLGLTNTPVLLLLQESVSWEQRGVATAAMSFFRTIGGSIAVGALGAILAAHLVGAADPATLAGIMGPKHGVPVDAALLARVSFKLEEALGTIFEVVGAMTIATFAFSFFFPNLRLGHARTSDDAAPENASGDVVDGATH